ncbi:MAG: FAD-dependent oxidoreductase [Nitrososphaerota archaeon]|nr:FAD-dependent oxidoreductase [Nitrososphaerota archaeon]MDG7023665.1 FAD-dependent oxidoreductase [Nitrososphaerota archaeon]
MASSERADILVVGAGVLGVTLSYWLSSLYDCKIALADLAQAPGAHTSSRNTGVIHRPFYLDPRKKKVFAKTSLLSHPLWERLAKDGGLPWKPVGTINVAVDENEIRTLAKYGDWGVENGMEDSEIELLDGRAVRSREPEVRCRAGLLSKTDVSVDFGAFTRHLWRVVISRGVRFLGGCRVSSLQQGRDGEVRLRSAAGVQTLSCRLLLNAAGGGALEIAHALGLAREYAALNFRGEYWVVDEPFALRVNSNIYRPPRFPQYPFLDPHFVVRADGSRQIGPNAVAVPGPYVYSGVGLAELGAFLRRPVVPKAKLLANRGFLSLLAGEWRSSLSKSAMCDRVKKFVPGLSAGMLRRRAVFGVRSSVVDSSGFVPEALLLKGEASAHIINFNSPGATGAPSYSAMVVDELRSAGMLEGFGARRAPDFIPGWEFDAASGRAA